MYKILPLFYLISLTLIPSFLLGQNLEAYVNQQGNFIIQDGFQSITAEAVAPVSYKVGRTLIAYNDVSQQFKVYQNGKIISPTNQLVSQYSATDNLLTMESGGILRVYDEGKTTLLSSRYDFYLTADSLVFYNDQINQKIYAYYNGEVQELEDFLTSRQLQSFVVGDNIIGYLDYSDRLKMFYQGELQVIEYNTVSELAAGRDILCYVDVNSSFKAYYKGESYTLEDFAPKHKWVGDGYIAYVSYDGNLKIFYKGSIKDMGLFTPKQASASDFVFYYTDFNGYFKAFHEGEFYQLDTQYPDKVMSKYHSIAFIDRFHNLKFFRENKLETVTSLQVKDPSLDYDILKYTLGLNSVKVYGKEAYN